MTPDELIALNDQIAGMARAGLPLDQGLAGMARDMAGGRLRRVTQAIADDVRAGHPLPEAIDRQKAALPPYYAALVLAGVRTGRIAEVLATLSVYARAVAGTRAVVVEALFYPAVVLAFTFGLYAMLAFVVLPQFREIYDGFGLKLPLLTEWLLAVGGNPAVFVAAPVGALVGVAGVWAVLRLTPRGRLLTARAAYAVPVFGTLLRSARLAAFADLLAVLVEHDVPLPEAFRLAGAATADPVTAGVAAEVEEQLSHGAPLGAALRGRGLVPEWVAWMAAAGEQRGGLAPALRQIAGVYRRQVEARATVLRSVLPAALIVVTAGITVALFVLALMLPMFKLLEGLSK